MRLLCYSIVLLGVLASNIQCEPQQYSEYYQLSDEFDVLGIGKDFGKFGGPIIGKKGMLYTYILYNTVHPFTCTNILTLHITIYLYMV